MKKLSYILIVSFFAFFACQTDTVNTETDAFEDNAVELKSSLLTSIGEFNRIPKRFASNPEAYIENQLNSIAKGDEVRYGCVTFVGGLAIIDEDCTITSGVPDEYDDCDLKGVRTITCGVNPYNPLCTICAVAYILECDGELGWVIGYNIICAIGPIEIPFPIPF
ncbi:hypothetical protein [Kordia sp.]|uniref:hypothetical protein n=1 Tax=Kordia sp. TaxID=1965332 RepID=UPI003D6AD645